MSLVFPWEVIESIIDLSYEDAKTLRSFSLTCRQLRPRSFRRMIAYIHLKSQDAVFDFCDHVKAHPSLRPIVNTLTIDLADFAPFPLLHILPNLSQITLVAAHSPQDDPYAYTLHPSSLTCYQRFGTRIRSLRLSGTHCWTPEEFSRLLLAFQHIEDLVCGDVRLVTVAGNAPRTQVAKQNLARRMRLRSMTVSVRDSMEFDDLLMLFRRQLDREVDDADVVALLFEAAQTTAESLCLVLAYWQDVEYSERYHRCIRFQYSYVLS